MEYELEQPESNNIVLTFSLLESGLNLHFFRCA